MLPQLNKTASLLLDGILNNNFIMKFTCFGSKATFVQPLKNSFFSVTTLLNHIEIRYKKKPEHSTPFLLIMHTMHICLLRKYGDTNLRHVKDKSQFFE